LAVEIISTGLPGIVGNGPSFIAERFAEQSSVSDDGRYLVFTSRADDLVPADNNGRNDVFRYDTVDEVVELVSADVSGTTTGNAASFDAVISGDGTKIVFASAATNLTSDLDGNFANDLFLRDMVTGETTLISKSTAGGMTGNGRSVDAAISQDGMRVAFASDASDLAEDDFNFNRDIFLYDVTTATTTLVTRDQTGTGSALGRSDLVQISADGSTLVYISQADDLTPELDFNSASDVFAFDIATGTNQLVSVNLDGTATGAGESRLPVVSADGGVVAFESIADDLIAGDTNGSKDVFLRDLVAGTTELISVNLTGVGGGNGDSDFAQISGDGNLVVFQSRASILTGNDSNGSTQDIFIRDRLAETTSLVSRNFTGSGSGNALSREHAISRDGSIVVFETSATNLSIASDNNFGLDLFAYDVASTSLELLSKDETGFATGNNNSFDPVVSADGSLVVFESLASDLVTGDSGTDMDIFYRRPFSTTGTQVASRSGMPSGNAPPANGDSFISDATSPIFSADGRFVVFVSDADDLVPNNLNERLDVFRYDRQEKKIELVSRNLGGTQGGNADSTNPSISDDGQLVVFQSDASNLVVNDTNSTTDVFAYDFGSGEMTLVSIDSSGLRSGDFSSQNAHLNSLGTEVVFESFASDLVLGDFNFDSDIFIRDLTSRSTTRISNNSFGEAASGGSFRPHFSGDGTTVVFESFAGDLVDEDFNFEVDVFAHDVASQTTVMVSVQSDGMPTGSGGGNSPSVSHDGKRIAFVSSSGTLVENDDNFSSDVFVRDLATGETELVSRNATGSGSGDSFSVDPRISADGNSVAFASSATDLVDSPADISFSEHVYHRDLSRDFTTLVSVNADGTASGNNSSSLSAISPDGSVVAFKSRSNNLVPGDFGFDENIFVHDLLASSTRLVTENLDGTGGVNLSSGSAVFSPDGRSLLFHSNSTNLVEGDATANNDVFLATDFLSRPPSVGDQAFSIPENTPVQSVGFVSADDFDLPDDELTFFIIGGSGAGVFDLDAATGEITVLDPSALDFEINDRLTLEVVVEDLDSNSATATITIDVEDVIEAGPVVTEVIVDSSDWGPLFRDFADGILGDDLARGVPIPRGEDQTKSLPWVGVDRIHVVFSENVTGADLSAFSLQAAPGFLGLNGTIDDGSFGQVPSVSAVDYDEATFTATLQLSHALQASVFDLRVTPGAIETPDGAKLDGEWINGTSNLTSGDGDEGGDFSFRIVSLPGDVDGELLSAGQSAVNMDDLEVIRSKQVEGIFQFGETVLVSPGYDPRADLNGSGVINADEVDIYRDQQNALVLPIPVLAASQATLSQNLTVLVEADPEYGTEDDDDESLTDQAFDELYGMEGDSLGSRLF